MLTQFSSFAVYASTQGTQISNGIDYSGQGTVINGDIRGDSSCTVSGNYVYVPTYTYGAYTYSTWDEFWASWSDWSPSNSKYAGYKGYRYAAENKHIVDFESKTEYQYRRWNSEINPVYKTKYYTKYQKCTRILFVNIYTYTTEYSFNGYPGAKSGYTVYERWTERVIDHYNGGYEYSNTWSDSAPFTWFWENDWTAYNSRKTYRVKKIDSTWDPNWKNNSTEAVPLRYSLYKKNGEPISTGIRWTYSSSLSGPDNSIGGFGFSTTSYGNVYYVTSKEIIDILFTDIETMEDEIGHLEWVSFILAGFDALIGYFIDMPKEIALGLAIMNILVGTNDYIMNDLKSGKINSFQEAVNEVRDSNTVLVVTDVNNIFNSVTYVGYGSYAPTMDYYQSTNIYATNLDYVSMDAYENNGYGTEIGFGSKKFGTISYGVSAETIIDLIEFSLTYNYPVLCFWNS